MFKKISGIIIALLILGAFPSIIFAQNKTDNPVYIVEPGENLTEIAIRFDLTLEELIAANSIVDLNFISPGTELVIPGFEGVSGILTTTPVQFGESVGLILGKHQLTFANFQKLNKLTSPSETFLGKNLILPQTDLGNNNPFTPVSIAYDSSVFDTALRYGANKWDIWEKNSFSDKTLLPGDVIILSSPDKPIEGNHIIPHIKNVKISPLPLIQGRTAVIKLFTDHNSIEILAEKNGQNLTFYPSESDPTSFHAFDGIHALAEPGIVPLHIEGIIDGKQEFVIDQMILISPGGYQQETLTVESTLIDEALNIREGERIQDILNYSSDQKFWEGPFRFPIDGSLDDGSISISSYFGNRRSYNNGQYKGFHGGLDFWVVLNTLNIYAPAAGRIIAAEPMDIRGFTTFIDHGQGVVSGYAHQSEILVQVGQMVEKGELIGLIGKTGRVTGPHLHWDIWVNGNQIDPFDWINNTYP